MLGARHGRQRVVELCLEASDLGHHLRGLDVEVRRPVRALTQLTLERAELLAQLRRLLARGHRLPAPAMDLAERIELALHRGQGALEGSRLRDGLVLEPHRLRVDQRHHVRTEGLADPRRGELLMKLVDPLRERIALVLDRCAILALEIEPRRERAVQSHRRRQRAARGQQTDHQATDEDDFAGRHRRALHLVRADEDAVRATEILDPQRALLEEEPRMHARHARVLAADRALHAAAHHDRFVAERERAVDAVSVRIDEGRHSLAANLSRSGG